MKTFLLWALLVLSASAQVVPGSGSPTSQIVGQIQTATGGTINNGTLTFTLSQPAIVAGSATLATQISACYTSTAGNIVGTPDPIVPAIVSTNTGSGTLPAGTYFVEIYYTTTNGTVSAVSPETSVILTSMGTVIVNPPLLKPASASGFGIALSTASGTETIQGTILGLAGQFQQSTPLVAGAAAPTVNNTTCNLYFSDQLVPTGTYYTVGLKNKSATQVAGFPQSWCTYGGAGATINVSQGAPTGNCNVSGVFYPTPIFANPAGGNQSITGNLTVTGNLEGGSINSLCIAGTPVTPSLAAAVTCAGTSGTIEVAMLPMPALTANVTIPAGVTTRFDGPNCVTTTGFTLTINGPLVAPPAQIFCGSGTVIFGTAVNSAAVEWFGAVGDWNGSTGTDNTAAIQSCLSALASGVCTFQAKSYKTSSALSITKSAVGVVGVDSFQANTGFFTSVPPLSTIVCTSAAADILDITGVSTSNTVYGNVLKNIALTRTAIPTGTAKGLNLSFSYKAQISNVVSEDSIYDFYFRGVGSMGFGYIENNIASWGYNGVTETAGSLYGFYVDTSAGVFSPSIRIRNNHAASNLGLGAFTTYGYANVGTLGADWHLFHDESAGVNYGIYFNNSGSGFTASSDIQIVDPIMDGCLTTCLFSTGLSGSMSVTGGWLNPQGANAVAADFESASAGSQASFYNTTIFGTGLTGGTAAIIGHNVYNLQLVGNKIQTQTSSIPAISFNGVTGGTIEGNDIWSTAGTTTLVNLVSTINVPISSNTLNGNSTNGIVLDSATHGIAGLETNTCGASIASITNCTVDSGGNQAFFVSGYLSTPVAFASLPSCVAGLEGLSRAVNNSNTATYNATVAGGGTNHIVAYCNGTNWVAH